MVWADLHLANMGFCYFLAGQRDTTDAKFEYFLPSPAIKYSLAFQSVMIVMLQGKAPQPPKKTSQNNGVGTVCMRWT